MKLLGSRLRQIMAKKLIIDTGAETVGQERSRRVQCSGPLMISMLIIFSSLSLANDGNAKSDMSDIKMSLDDPYGNYKFLLDKVTQNRETIVNGSRYLNMLDKPYCIKKINDLINGEMNPVNPSYRAVSEQELVDFLKKEYQCDNFSHAPVTYTAGSRKIRFFQEGPYLVYQFQHQEDNYFSLIGTGAVKNKDHPRTQEVDYEFETFPYFMIYSGKNCEYSTGISLAGSREERGNNSFSGFLSGMDGSVYSYGITLRTTNRGSFEILPLFWAEEREKENYCATSFELTKQEGNQ